MYDLDIKDLLNVFIVGCDLEYGTGSVLDTGNVDGYDIRGHPLPSHVVTIAMDTENLRPKSEEKLHSHVVTIAMDAENLKKKKAIKHLV